MFKTIPLLIAMLFDIISTDMNNFVIRSSIDKSKMKDVQTKDLADFKRLSKKYGYTVRENKEARESVRPYYIAELGDDTMGTFSVKYPKQSYLLVP